MFDSEYVRMAPRVTHNVIKDGQWIDVLSIKVALHSTRQFMLALVYRMGYGLMEVNSKSCIHPQPMYTPRSQQPRYDQNRF